MMRDWLQAVERTIVTQWDSVDKAPEAFPEICRQALAAVTPAMDRDAFMHHLLHLDYPKQGYPQNEFGNAAVTLLRNADFRIDAYIWEAGLDMSIHDHHFMGAYRPLYGRSRQFSFTFAPTRDIDATLTEGQLTHGETRLIAPGEAATIPLGDELIHLVQHIDTPTITVCVRTDDLPGHQLRSYFFPGYRLRFNPFRTPSRKKLNVLQVMACSQMLDRASTIESVLEQLTPGECFSLLVRPNKHTAHFRDPFKGQFAKAVREHIQRLLPAWLFIPGQHPLTIKQLLAAAEASQPLEYPHDNAPTTPL